MPKSGPDSLDRSTTSLVEKQSRDGENIKLSIFLMVKVKYTSQPSSALALLILEHS
jgi:hypothetical protein